MQSRLRRLWRQHTCQDAVGPLHRSLRKAYLAVLWAATHLVVWDWSSVSISFLAPALSEKKINHQLEAASTGCRAGFECTNRTGSVAGLPICSRLHCQPRWRPQRCDLPDGCPTRRSRHFPHCIEPQQSTREVCVCLTYGLPYYLQFSIRPYQQNSQMNRNGAMDTWASLDSAITQIHEQNASQLSFEELYRHLLRGLTVL